MLLFFWGSCSNSPGFCHPSQPRYIGGHIRKHLEISPNISLGGVFTAQCRKPRRGRGVRFRGLVNSYASLRDNEDDAMVTGMWMCTVPSPRAGPCSGGSRHQPLAPRSSVGGHHCHVILGTWGPAQSGDFRRPRGPPWLLHCFPKWQLRPRSWTPIPGPRCEFPRGQHAD